MDIGAALSKAHQAFGLDRAAQDVGRVAALVSVQVIKKIAQALGMRLTKAKLAQIVPLVGAGVGAGFNAWYVANACSELLWAYSRTSFMSSLTMSLVYGRQRGNRTDYLEQVV